jgi:hypothetical protein
MPNCPVPDPLHQQLVEVQTAEVAQTVVRLYADPVRATGDKCNIESSRTEVEDQNVPTAASGAHKVQEVARRRDRFGDKRRTGQPGQLCGPQQHPPAKPTPGDRIGERDRGSAAAVRQFGRHPVQDRRQHVDDGHVAACQPHRLLIDDALRIGLIPVRAQLAELLRIPTRPIPTVLVHRDAGGQNRLIIEQQRPRVAVVAADHGHRVGRPDVDSYPHHSGLPARRSRRIATTSTP